MVVVALFDYGIRRVGHTLLGMRESTRVDRIPTSEQGVLSEACLLHVFCNGEWLSFLRHNSQGGPRALKDFPQLRDFEYMAVTSQREIRCESYVAQGQACRPNTLFEYDH